MAGGREILAGVSCSLSGRFGLQGRQALNGIALWVEYSAPALPVRLIAYDDESRAAQARANVLRLLTSDRVDLLLGPYSSGLTLAVAPIAEAHRTILWNHGGASDDLSGGDWRHLVTVVSPASDYFRDLATVVRGRAPAASRMAILHARRGGFAAHVARGAAEGARLAGFRSIAVHRFESPLRDLASAARDAILDQPDLLVGVGTFHDDVALARARSGMPKLTGLAVVAAGLGAFAEALGELADGVIGPSQWEPEVSFDGLTGPDSAWFCSTYLARFRQAPEYPAAQAFAAGVVFAECFRRAGRLDGERLLEAARDLDLTTFFGGFRLDPATGRQIGHRIVLTEWRGGRKAVIAPAGPRAAREARDAGRQRDATQGCPGSDRGRGSVSARRSLAGPPAREGCP